MRSFTKSVRNTVRQIPRGKVLSYKEVAAKVGRPKAARAVANIMAKNFDPRIPCHRVIRSDGGLGGYNRGGEVAKRKLLLEESAIV